MRFGDRHRNWAATTTTTSHHKEFSKKVPRCIHESIGGLSTPPDGFKVSEACKYGFGKRGFKEIAEVEEGNRVDVAVVAQSWGKTTHVTSMAIRLEEGEVYR